MPRNKRVKDRSLKHNRGKERGFQEEESIHIIEMGGRVVKGAQGWGMVEVEGNCMDCRSFLKFKMAY